MTSEMFDQFFSFGINQANLLIPAKKEQFSCFWMTDEKTRVILSNSID